MAKLHFDRTMDTLREEYLGPCAVPAMSSACTSLFATSAYSRCRAQLCRSGYIAAPVHCSFPVLQSCTQYARQLTRVSTSETCAFAHSHSTTHNPEQHSGASKSSCLFATNGAPIPSSTQPSRMHAVADWCARNRTGCLSILMFLTPLAEVTP